MMSWYIHPSKQLREDEFPLELVLTNGNGSVQQVYVPYRTCHNAMPLLPSGMPYPDSWMCSECGGRMDGIILEVGDYCPNCGSEVRA